MSQKYLFFVVSIIFSSFILQNIHAQEDGLPLPSPPILKQKPQRKKDNVGFKKVSLTEDNYTTKDGTQVTKTTKKTQYSKDDIKIEITTHQERPKGEIINSINTEEKLLDGSSMKTIEAKTLYPDKTSSTSHITIKTKADGSFTEEGTRVKEGTDRLSETTAIKGRGDGEGTYTSESTTVDQNSITIHKDTFKSTPTEGSQHVRYFPDGRRTSVTDYEGTRTSIDYDSEGKIIRIEKKTGNRAKVTLFYEDGSRTDYEFENGKIVSTTQYDKDGNMISSDKKIALNVKDGEGKSICHVKLDRALDALKEGAPIKNVPPIKIAIINFFQDRFGLPAITFYPSGVGGGAPQDVKVQKEGDQLAATCPYGQEGTLVFSTQAKDENGKTTIATPIAQIVSSDFIAPVTQTAPSDTIKKVPSASVISAATPGTNSVIATEDNAKDLPSTIGAVASAGDMGRETLSVSHTGKSVDDEEEAYEGEGTDYAEQILGLSPQEDPYYENEAEDDQKKPVFKGAPPLPGLIPDGIDTSKSEPISESPEEALAGFIMLGMTKLDGKPDVLFFDHARRVARAILDFYTSGSGRSSIGDVCNKLFDPSCIEKEKKKE